MLNVNEEYNKIASIDGVLQIKKDIQKYWNTLGFIKVRNDDVNQEEVDHLLESVGRLVFSFLFFYINNVLTIYLDNYKNIKDKAMVFSIIIFPYG